ncbi:MAG: hypothetical protein AMXMBFR82_26340 [Candidatus Hydrogenedentota bacterium]
MSGKRNGTAFKSRPQLHAHIGTLQREHLACPAASAILARELLQPPRPFPTPPDADEHAREDGGVAADATRSRRGCQAATIQIGEE